MSTSREITLNLDLEENIATATVTEENLDEYDRVVILDYKDEYGGLVEAHDGVKRFILGPREISYPPEFWKALLEGNEGVQFPRHRLRPEQWREVVATIVYSAREYGDVLVVIDEAHFAAPQSEGYPDPIKGLATTGRGEQVSSMWVTQRLQEIDQTIISQCTSRVLGAFGDDRDLAKLRKAVGYPVEVHNPNVERVPSLPPELEADGEKIPVRRFEDDDGNTIGSEWIYSDDTGTRERRDTRDVEMTAPHKGPQGKDLRTP